VFYFLLSPMFIVIFIRLWRLMKSSFKDIFVQVRRKFILFIFFVEIFILCRVFFYFEIRFQQEDIEH